jgi:hypothetical protein
LIDKKRSQPGALLFFAATIPVFRVKPINLYCLFLQYMLMKSNITRSLVALMVCIVLLFAITPKRTIHELFGCHNPRELQKEKSEGLTQLDKDGFHCSCDQPEFQQGYFAGSSPAIPTPFPVLGSDPTVLLSQQLYKQAPLHISLRGPPQQG